MVLMLRYGLLLTLLFLLGHTNVYSATQQRCLNCHAETVHQWAASDHGKAMQEANSNSVLGDFDDAVVTHFSQTAKFSKNGSSFSVRLTEGGTTTDYKVEYVFGHYPLQQYLVPTDNGKLQVFPFSWDSRPEAEGGQRWFPVYPQEDIHKNDRLHWLQPVQNWNGMCADCHSTGLKRNYASTTDEFDTQFTNINVGCLSCHTLDSDHGTASTNKPYDDQMLSASEQQSIGQWLIQDGDKIASWHGPKRDNTFMETCFGCHALRTPLQDGISPDQPFLDQFSPTLLLDPLYHADGQINEEVYVYGSFLQSKMYAAGVNCLDCHNPHTMKVKVQGNGLCLQCHAADAYNTQQHTNHPPATSGSQCVNCHMPTKTYMGVDVRRDHSFTIPRPMVSAQINSPNACISCHNDKTNQWAAENIKDWFGSLSSQSFSEQSYVQIMHGERLSLSQAMAVIYDSSLPVIKRATIIASLPRLVERLSDQSIRNLVRHKEPLIRLAVAQIGSLLPPDERFKSYSKLLNDEFKAVRVAAANNLVGLGLTTPVFKSAYDELYLANEINTWRGEGSFNQSLVAHRQGDLEGALKLLQRGIKVDPYFAANYINLAELYRSQGNHEQESATYERALQALPKNAVVHYSYGMHKIRQQDLQAAISAFKKATKLAPTDGQNWYILALALDKAGSTAQAIAVLKQGLAMNESKRLRELGVIFSSKMNDMPSRSYFQKIH